jgi:hypothetical protein
VSPRRSSAGGAHDHEDGDDDEPDDAEEWGETESVAEPDLSDWDDLPETEMSEEEHRRFVERELDAEGRPRRDPPVALVLALLTALALGAAILLL